MQKCTRNSDVSYTRRWLKELIPRVLAPCNTKHTYRKKVLTHWRRHWKTSGWEIKWTKILQHEKNPAGSLATQKVLHCKPFHLVCCQVSYHSSFIQILWMRSECSMRIFQHKKKILLLHLWLKNCWQNIADNIVQNVTFHFRQSFIFIVLATIVHCYYYTNCPRFSQE